MGGGGEVCAAAEEQGRAIIRAAKRALEEQAERAQGVAGRKLSLVRSLEQFLEKRRKATNTAAAEESSSSYSPVG